MASDSVKLIGSEAIFATDLTKWFGEGENKMTAMKGVALVAHFGEMLFIVGPFGSGKSTLLSMISGILRPNAGKVIVKGVDVGTLNNDQLADFRLNTIGFSPATHAPRQCDHNRRRSWPQSFGHGIVGNHLVADRASQRKG
jgi:energy-coupling factor transporter ATP-binding protein EcfA2